MELALLVVCLDVRLAIDENYRKRVWNAVEKKNGAVVLHRSPGDSDTLTETNSGVNPNPEKSICFD